MDDFRALGVAEKWGKRFESLALFIEPDRTPFAGFTRNLNRSDARAEAFRFALARLKVKPNRKRLLRRELCQVFTKFGDRCELDMIRFSPVPVAFRASGSTSFRAPLS